MKKLTSADWKRYSYQKDMFQCPRPFCDPVVFYRLFRKQYDSYEKQSFPILQGRDLYGGVKHYSFDELLQMTDGFRSPLICYTLFGTLYQGTIRTESGIQDVLVKTWEYFSPCGCDNQALYHTTRICDELDLLRDTGIKSHPNVVNLIGFHCERHLALIYEGGSFELLHKIILNDTFSWDDRMKVATDIACILEAFHCKKLVHGDVNSKNIVVNKDNCPVVFDFSLFAYHEDRMEYKHFVRKLYHNLDKYLDGPPWFMVCDIFAYGILLLELINKRVYPKFTLPVQTINKILNYDHEKSFVHDSFYAVEHTALGITKLAIKCSKVNLDEQPSIQEIVRELKDLLPYNRPNKL